MAGVERVAFFTDTDQLAPRRSEVRVEELAIRQHSFVDLNLPTFDADAKGMATRKASGEVLSALAPALPDLARLRPGMTVEGTWQLGIDADPAVVGGAQLVQRDPVGGELLQQLQARGAVVALEPVEQALLVAVGLQPAELGPLLEAGRALAAF